MDSSGSQKPVEVFFSYSHEDRGLLHQLQNHLTPLKRSGYISEWYDGKIEAGAEWDAEIKAHLNSAAIILLLISSDFLASDYCYGVEMIGALERHEKGKAYVIPVILRPVHWKYERFAKLKALPLDGKPIREWENIDRAFVSVVEGIQATIGKLATVQQVSETLQRLTSAPVVALPGAVRNRKFFGEIAPGVFHYSFEKELLGNWTTLYMTSGDTPGSFGIAPNVTASIPKKS